LSAPLLKDCDAPDLNRLLIRTSNKRFEMTPDLVAWVSMTYSCVWAFGCLHIQASSVGLQAVQAIQAVIHGTRQQANSTKDRTRVAQFANHLRNVLKEVITDIINHFARSQMDRIVLKELLFLTAITPHHHQSSSQFPDALTFFQGVFASLNGCQSPIYRE
jgi:hypothetical protein